MRNRRDKRMGKRNRRGYQESRIEGEERISKKTGNKGGQCMEYNREIISSAYTGRDEEEKKQPMDAAVTL